MGIRLVVEVLDHAPDELTHGDVRLLAAIAEDANDATREGWPGWELLARRMRWAGHKDGGKNAVRKGLSGLDERLADAGYRDGVRVRIRDGKDGRPVYAVRGHATVFRVPKLRPPAGCGCDRCSQREARSASLQRGAEGASLTDAKGGKNWRQREAKTGAKGGSECLPSPQSPQVSPHRRRARETAAERIAAAGARDDEIHKVIDKIKHYAARNHGDHITDIDAYIGAFPPEDIAARLGEVRAETSRAEPEPASTQPTGPPLIASSADEPPEVGRLLTATRTVYDSLRKTHPDVTAEEAIDVHRAVLDANAEKWINQAYLNTMARNGSFAPFLVGIRADTRRKRGREVEAELIELRTGPPCEHDEPGGKSLHPASGVMLCPLCEAGLPPTADPLEGRRVDDPVIDAVVDAYRRSAAHLRQRAGGQAEPGSGEQPESREIAIRAITITRQAKRLRDHIPAEQLVAFAALAGERDTDLNQVIQDEAKGAAA